MSTKTITITATTTREELGLLSRLALRYADMIEQRARAAGSTPADWEPLTDFVAVDEFKRVGAYQEVMTWDEYVKFLTQWAGATRFETTMHRVMEIGRVVIQELEERHYKGDEFIKKNVVAVYEFDAADKIRRLDIYEQAKDSGRWIVQAAHEAVS